MSKDFLALSTLILYYYTKNWKVRKKSQILHQKKPILLSPLIKNNYICAAFYKV